MLNKLIIIPFFILFSLSNCTAAHYWNIFNTTNNTNPTPEYNNFYHLFVKGGLLFHMNKMPGGIGSNAASKYSGTKCSHSFLYIVSIGDSSLTAAAKEAKIQKIASVSYEQFAIITFFYHRFCTTVTGE